MKVMKKLALWVGMVLCFSVFSLGFLPRWSFKVVIPDLFIITSVCAGIFKGSVFGAVVGLLCGFVEGSLAGVYHGQFVASRLTAGFVSGWLKETILHEHWLTPLLCALAGSVASQLAMFITAPQLVISFADQPSVAVAKATTEIAYAVLLSPALVFLKHAFEGKYNSESNVELKHRM